MDDDEISDLIFHPSSPVDRPYLACRSAGCEAAWRQTDPTAAGSTYPRRRWRDLLLHLGCGVDMLCESKQCSIRDSEHGQPIIPCFLM